MAIGIGLGMAEFPFSSAKAFWKWVEMIEAGGVDSLWWAQIKSLLCKAEPGRPDVGACCQVEVVQEEAEECAAGGVEECASRSSSLIVRMSHAKVSLSADGEVKIKAYAAANL